MKFPPFKLEDYLSHYEFRAPYLLCCSDAESITLTELLNFANDDMLRAWHNLRLGYTEVAGDPALRCDIAHLYQGLTAEHIFCFAGAEEGIFATCHALLEAEDHVIVFAPCYQSLQTVPQSIGCEVTTLALREEDQWKIDLEALKKALRPTTKLVVINTPHNPTGQYVDQETLDAMIALLRTTGTYLFADEVYMHLGPTHTSWPKHVAECYERGISLNVMSKAYGLAGLRLGWIATKDKDVLQKCAFIKHYLTICNAAPSEILARIALQARDALIGRNNALIDKNLKQFDTFIDEHSTLLSWVRPVGGCTGFVRYHGKDTTDHLAQKLIDDCGVLILPSSVYDAGEHHFRAGFGRVNCEEGLARFGAFLKHMS